MRITYVILFGLLALAVLVRAYQSSKVHAGGIGSKCTGLSCASPQVPASAPTNAIGNKFFSMTGYPQNPKFTDKNGRTLTPLREPVITNQSGVKFEIIFKTHDQRVVNQDGKSMLDVANAAFKAGRVDPGEFFRNSFFYGFEIDSRTPFYVDKKGFYLFPIYVDIDIRSNSQEAVFVNKKGFVVNEEGKNYAFINMDDSDFRKTGFFIEYTFLDEPFYSDLDGRYLEPTRPVVRVSDGRYSAYFKTFDGKYVNEVGKKVDYNQTLVNFGR